MLSRWEGMRIHLWGIVILGIIQGLTEFLPVSSSGHLVIAQNLLNISAPGVVLELVLHLGTLLSVVIVFWQDVMGLLQGFFSLLLNPKLKKPVAKELLTYRRLVPLLIIGLIPTALFGLFLEPIFEHLFSSTLAVAFALLLTGVVLFLISRLASGRRDLAQLTALDALTVGIAQGCAIVPGLSRSGMTISSALGRGLNRDAATRFSFLISIPTIGGAALLKIKDIISFGSQQWGSLWLGFIVAAITGVAAIKILVRLLKQGRLQVFAYYVWIMGLFIICRSWWG